jgi:Carboxypeptidase regulatory-like domain
MSKRILFAVVVCLAAFLCGQAAFGQATGAFQGTVTDKSGSAIVGASVKATSQGTGAVREATTDDSGHYIITLLPVSVYTIRVEFKDFQTTESKDVRLQVDEQRELDFALAPASVSSSVEVIADAVAVETANPSLGQVITSEQVTQLPLNGRNFVQLATLTPGTVQETNPNSFFNGGPSSEVSARGSFSLSVAGSRANSTDWLLDGTDNNELTGGGIGILSSIDDIQEFKVLTYNYSAEYGTRAGPTVLVTTKSGTNDFHGSLFEFLRNTSLDAKSFFATSTEKFNLNQFGGAIGGPIRKNKTFFFVDGEQKYQRHGITFAGLVPSDAMRPTAANPNADFTNDALGNPAALLTNPNVNGSPDPHFRCSAPGVPMPASPSGDGSQVPGGTDCNVIPVGLINPIAAQMINLYPHPNASNQEQFVNFLDEPVRSLDETKMDVRVDHNISASDSLFARFSYDQATSFVPGGAPGFAEQAPFASNQGIINHGRNISIGETHIFSPRTVNQFNFGYNRIFDYITSQGTGSCEASKIGIPGANLGCDSSNTCLPNLVSCGLTSTQFDTYWSLGDRGFSPFNGGTNIFSFNDSLDLIRGKHDIKVGMTIRANQMNVKTEGFQDGYWILTGLWSGDPQADFLLGLPSLAIHDQTFNGITTGRRWKIFRPYVQDDWRITKNLTLNLGFAWDLTTPISEVGNRQANFNPVTAAFAIAGQGADKWAGIQFDKRALEPRIGLAWKPFGSDKTAVRAGYAIYHDSSWSQGAQGLWQNPPYYAESDSFAFGGACTFATAACAKTFGLTPSAINMSDGFPIFTSPPDPASFTGTIQSQNTNFKLGTVQQFNINVEHQLPGQIVLTAGYAGSRSTHILIDGNNLNVSTPLACTGGSYTLGCGPGGSFVAAPYATSFPFSTIANITDQGTAHYNGLQLKAETKNSRHGIYALIGYTYSRTYDNGFSDGLGSTIGATYFPLPGWSKLDWALSQINVNNNFTASVIYDLPFGKGKHYGNEWNSVTNALLGNWQMTIIEKITSGFPVFVVDSANFSSGVNFQNNGNSLIRPDQVCSPTSGSHSLSEYFNTACFAFPAAGELGNASRTPLSGPDYVNTDFSVIKQFALPWEHMGLNFRAEFFNLFNHAQFGQPGADINAPSFGKISSTVGNPRVVQFGLKLTF